MRFVVASVAVAALVSSAHAKFITTNDKSVFELFSQQGGYSLAAENFSGFSGFYPTLGGGSGSTAWQASALGGLYVGSGGQLSTNNADAALTLTFSSGDVYAVGGNFFLTDINFGFLPGLVQVELADGSSYIANIQSANAFSGFVSLGSAISQITISPFGIQPNAYVTATNLCLGVVPAPGAVALLAVAGLASRRRR
jgi:hypothetical protein